jgi:ribose transport system permease protein
VELSVNPENAVPQSKAAPARRGASGLGRVAGTIVGDFGTVLLLAVLFIVFALTSQYFLTVANLQNVLLTQTLIGCMALGVMFPLIIGEFDLSVGYMLGFVAMVGAYLSGQGWTAPAIIPVMLAVGVLGGLINGLFSEKLHISSFIATLGTGIVLNGLTDGLSGGRVLSSNIPHVVQRIGNGYAAGLAISVWITLGLAVLLFYLLEHTPLGRSLYAIGGSQTVSFLAGLRTGWLKIAAFVFSGLMVGIGAVFALGQNGSASPGFGAELLLPAYAAAFLGVTTYRGGRYNVVGTVVGLLLLGIGFNGLSLYGVPFWVQPVFNGGVLLIAVLVARSERRHVMR